MHKNQDTAILFFTRTAKEEAVSKSWTSIPELDHQIATTLIRRTRHQLQKAPFPVIKIEEGQQEGCSFGERLGNAFKLVFNKGYRYVIAIGNDCQNLNPDWRAIQNKLRAGKTILGPDLRGGVYLLGISSTRDYKKIFAEISWNNAFVFDQLKSHFQNHYTLAPRRDFNVFNDLRSDVQLVRLLKRFLEKDRVPTNEKNFTDSFLYFYQPLRAPPLYPR